MQYHHINFIETKPTHWATDKAYSSVDAIITTLNARNQNLSDFLINETLQHLTKLDLSKNSLTELVFELDMLELEFLDLSYNKVPLEKVVFKGHFPKLKYLYVYESQLKSIVFEKAMPQLEILTLSNNQLTSFDLPNGFDDLVALRLDGNQLSNFEINPYDIEHLDYLNLKDNPFNENSLIQGYANNSENCLQAILEYFDQKEVHDVGFDNECKVLLIGEGNVGKSCFVERLTEDRFKAEWDSTHAIAIKPYSLQKYMLNLWDFGGQDIYHATHRLFMSSNALYLLFWDKVTEASDATPCFEDGEEREYKVHKIPYWLNYTKSLGKGSPCIVVQTKSGKHGETDIPNQTKVRQRFQDIIVKRNGFQHIESQEDDWEENGYEDLLQIIKRSIKKIKENSQLLTNCIAIRQALRDAQQAGQKLMPFEEYATIINENGILNNGVINPMSLLKTWLVRTGVVYYREGLMNNQIILNQGWAIEAIYSLFDRQQYYHRLAAKNGQVDGKDLVQIWSPTFDEQEQDLFIDFMLSCELCFETTPKLKEERYKTEKLAERRFVVPQLLSYKRPTTQIEDFLEDKASWFIRYEHDFWHYGIMQSFIVRAKDLAEERAIWQIGILLKEGKSRALVEAQGKNVIVQVTRNGKQLLDKIRNELNDINQDNQDSIRESISLDGESYVSVEKLKNCNRNNETIKTENGKDILLKDLLFFLETNQNVRFKTSKTKEKMNSSQLKDLIAENELEEVLNFLGGIVPEKYQTDVILLKSQFNGLSTAERRGLRTKEGAGVDGRVLANNILSLLQELERKGIISDDTPEEVIEPTPIPQPSPSGETGKRKILFLAASPKNMARLGVDQEFAEVEKQINISKYRNNFNLESEFAVKSDKILLALEDKPEIIHFAGHGNEEGIYITDRNGEAQLLDEAALTDLFEDCASLKAVLLNACYSEKQAQAISTLKNIAAIGYTIENDDEIPDEVAIEFSSGFYLGLGANKDVIGACKFGRRKVKMRYSGIKIKVSIWKNGRKTEL
ncbi:MAG: COR domain-containing protein [Saprospiraceae bacterium]